MVLSLMSKNLATFGSLVGIISIGIGAFTQQAIRATPCEQPVAEVAAFIPVAFTSDALMRTKIIDGNQEVEITPPMKAAIVNGLAGLQSSTMVAAMCDSGNYKFPVADGITHSSLGISSYCADTTSLINQKGDIYWQDDVVDTIETPLADRMWSNYTFIHQTMAYALNSYALGGRWVPFITTSLTDWTTTYSEVLALFNLPSHAPGIVNSSLGIFNIMMTTTNPCEDSISYSLYKIREAFAAC
jgi:hypothetical protein